MMIETNGIVTTQVLFLTSIILIIILQTLLWQWDVHYNGSHAHHIVSIHWEFTISVHSMQGV